MPSKYENLLKDIRVRRWYDNLAMGSKVTADVYLRKFGSFCNLNGLTPGDLVTLGEEELEGKILDYISLMESKGFAGSYVNHSVKAVKSWLSFNRKEIKVRIKIKGAQDTPSLKDERVPTRDELKKILLSGNMKARAASVLIAHSGLRIEVLGNYLGDDGLRVKDFPEMVIEGDKIEFKKTPTMIIVRKELSKARHQYFTFLSEEGCEYLKDYLEERIWQGEMIGLESPIITPKQRVKPFIRTLNISDAIREGIRKASFPWRPYVLRSYFDTQLMLAESKGLVLRDYRTFWMGHKGDIENRYTTNKQRLPEEVIEDMREAYKRSEDFLQTLIRRPPLSEEDKKEMDLRAVMNFAKSLGIDPTKVRIELAKEDPEFGVDDEIKAIQDSIRKIMGRTGLTKETKEDPPSQSQLVINSHELDKYLRQGWSYFNELKDGRIIIRKEA